MSDAIDQQRPVPLSSNGRTSGFDPEGAGSNPAGGANHKIYTFGNGGLVEASIEDVIRACEPTPPL